jgi:two-component system, OmpR family, sensor kinase
MSWSKPRFRLLGRLYIAGILLLAAMFTLPILSMLELIEPPWRGVMEKHARHEVRGLLVTHDRAATLRRIERDLGFRVVTFDPEGKPKTGHGTTALLAESLRLAERKGFAWLDDLRVLVAADPGSDFAFALVEFPAGSVYKPGLLPLAVALTAAAIFALALARSIGRPIARLAATARSFAAGDLRARSGIQRKDELGELARAFDDMADRVSSLVRSQKELLANISHELRTPLSRIHMAVDLAEQASAEKARNMLLEVGDDLRELEHLVEDVLTMARLDLAEGRATEPLSLKRREQALEEIIARARDRFLALHPERVLKVDGTDEHTRVNVDADLLVRALTNLLDNAAKYSDRSTHVSLAIEVGKAEVTLTVRDRGIGISADDLERVGTPFFRTHESRSYDTHGIGLGVSLARRIIEAHGGSFRLEGKLGAGTAAQIELQTAARSDTLESP